MGTQDNTLRIRKRMRVLSRRLKRRYGGEHAWSTPSIVIEVASQTSIEGTHKAPNLLSTVSKDGMSTCKYDRCLHTTTSSPNAFVQRCRYQAMAYGRLASRPTSRTDSLFASIAYLPCLLQSSRILFASLMPRDWTSPGADIASWPRTDVA
ncbi:hypothetical protein PMIN06_005093 [Paraphaeosphaeria minitans]